MTPADDPRGHVPDADPLDELASALVDGEATPEEEARAGEPEVAARVAAFEAVAQRVGGPVDPPTDEAREAAIAAALAAASSRPAAPSSLAEHRERRRRLPEWLPGVAAAVVIVVGLGVLLTSLGSGDRDDAAESADATAMATQTAGADGESGGGGAADEGAGEESADLAPTAGSSAAPDLGSFDDVGALADALRSERSLVEDGTDASRERASDDASLYAGCPTPPAEPGEVVDAASATLDGQPVWVYVLRFDDGPGRYVVVEQATCAELAAGDL